MIFVTGATGFLGHNLVPALVRAGHEVRALVRPTSNTAFLRELGVELATGDVLDRDSITQAMQGCDYVIHAAGLFRFWGEQRNFERVNVEGTAYVLEAALRHNVKRVVHVSTVVVIGEPQPGVLIDEKVPCRPADAYQRSKFDAENLVKMYALTTGLPVIILRPGACYGPWGNYAFNRLFFTDPLRGLRIRVEGGRNHTFPVFAADVAQAVLASLTRGRNGERYNVCGDCLTHNEANAIISRLANISAFRLNVPTDLILALARRMEKWAERSGREPYYPLNLSHYVFGDWRVSSEKAVAELGFVPTPFEEGARQTLDWQQQRRRPQ